MKTKRMFVLLEVDTTLKAKELGAICDALDLGHDTTVLQHHVNVAKPAPKVAAADDEG